MTKTFFSLVIQEKSVLQPSLIPLQTESYLLIKNAYVKLEKALSDESQDVPETASRRIWLYVGT